MATAKKAKKSVKSEKKLAAKTAAKKPAAKKMVKAVAKKAAPKAAAKSSAKKTAKPAPKAAPKAAAPKPTAKTTPKKANTNFTEIVSPLDDRVLVSVAKETETKTKSGLILLESSTANENLRGVVEATGRGHRNKKGKVRPLDLQVGDQVLFPQFVGSKVQIAGEELFILRESEVLGVLESN